MQAGKKLERTDPRRRALKWWLLVALLAAIGALYLPGVLAPGAGTFHDDGIYLGTARALAEGDGYRIISLPGEDVQTKYPPLFPASLAAMWTVLPDFPANLPLLRLVTVFWTVLWCRFAYLLLRREADAATASVLIVLTLCSPWVYFLATSLMSEALFAALTWAALWQFAGYEQRPDESSGRRRLWLAALLGGAAALTRMLGACFIAATVLWLLFRRRFRDAFVFGTVSAIFVVPWLAWTMLAGDGQSAAYYSASNYVSWNPISAFSWSESASVIGHNLFLLLLTPGYLFGFFEPETIPLLLLLGVLTCVGMVSRLRSGLGAPDFFLVVYLIAIALWPWPPIRFVAPLYPLVLLLAWRGVETVWSGVETIWRGVGTVWGRARRRRLSGAVVRRATAGVALILAMATLGITALSVSQSGMIVPAPECQDSWTEFESLFAWIESETPGDAVLAANLDPVLFLYTGRKAIRPFEADPVQLYYSRRHDREPLGPPSELAQRLRAASVDYLVTTPGTCFQETKHLERQLEALLSDGNGMLQVVERLSPATRVYAVHLQ